MLLDKALENVRALLAEARAAVATLEKMEALLINTGSAAPRRPTNNGAEADQSVPDRVRAAVQNMAAPFRTGQVIEHLLNQGAISAEDKSKVYAAINYLTKHGELRRTDDGELTHAKKSRKAGG